MFLTKYEVYGAFRRGANKNPSNLFLTTMNSDSMLSGIKNHYMLSDDPISSMKRISMI